MPQYKKVFDIGTYTGNGGQYRVGIPTLRSVGPTGTQVAGSTRFRAYNNNYLTRTPSSASNRQIWTWSGWIKRAGLGSSAAADQRIFGASGAAGTTNAYFTSGDVLEFYCYQSGYIFDLVTTQKFQDTSIWYHLVLNIDVTQATAANRVKIYINGSQITSFSTATYPTQNTSVLDVNNNVVHNLMKYSGGSSNYFDGYAAEVYFVDGQQLAATSFGEYNSDNIWVPKAYSGSYGTNGFYLPMNSSSNYATDQSGNGNNWTPTGFNVTTSNTSYDLMVDSPTDYLSGSMSTANNAGNYCTWSTSSSAVGSTGRFENGNLDASCATSAAYTDLRGTFVIPQSGKWYFEMYQYNANSGYINDVYLGIINQLKKGDTSSGTNVAGNYAYMFNLTNGNKLMNGVSSAYGTAPGSNKTVSVAFDADNNKIWFAVDGTWQASGDPASGTNSAGTTQSGINYVPCLTILAGNAESYRHYTFTNFGQRPFSYTPPTGFKSMNTYNITRPADSSLWFYGDTPDLMWIKNRSTTGLHTITDTVRGMGLNLVTSSTAADTSYPGVTEMNKFGMSIINDATSIMNGSTNSHVYWAWKAGGGSTGATVTNTSGSITSQVSANPSAGFSIVSYTGTGANATVGHGLGASPSMIIARNRNVAGSHWTIYHTSLTSAAYVVYLDLTNASTSTATQWNSTAPTSSVFSVGTNSDTNGSGNSMIAYCWAAIPGYSSFGSYTGNGSADGPFVYTGFRPRWLLVKCSSSSLTSGAHWVLMDTTRYTYNPNDNILYPNLSNSEGNGEPVDILSNGFKIRTTTGRWNYSGETFIYAAFAEIPFKYARSR